jgi:hypothetical protein
MLAYVSILFFRTPATIKAHIMPCNIAQLAIFLICGQLEAHLQGKVDLAIWQCCFGDVHLRAGECRLGNVDLTNWAKWAFQFGNTGLANKGLKCLFFLW